MIGCGAGSDGIRNVGGCVVNGGAASDCDCVDAMADRGEGVELMLRFGPPIHAVHGKFHFRLTPLKFQ